MGETDPVKVFEESGLTHRRLIEELLPDWDWKGKRALDFGCGSGRIIRNFLPETGEAEFWGCDIDRPSIDWLQTALPLLRHRGSGLAAPGGQLLRPDLRLQRLHPLHRQLGGLDARAPPRPRRRRPAAALLPRRGVSEALIGKPWDEDRIGMNPLLYRYPLDPRPLGRAFEILRLDPYVADGHPPQGHGTALLRKKAVAITEEDLLRLEPDEPRELAAIQHNVEQLRDDTLRLRTENAQLREHLAAAQAAAAENERLRNEIEGSSSFWRLTAPLRAAKARGGADAASCSLWPSEDHKEQRQWSGHRRDANPSSSSQRMRTPKGFGSVGMPTTSRPSAAHLSADPVRASRHFGTPSAE